MASEWRTERFGCMAQLVRDTVHPTEATGLSYVGLEHIGEGSLSLIGTGRAEDATSTKTRFRKGDILFGKLRPYFRKVIRAPFDGICSTDIWVIRPRVGIDASFLFYLMASVLFLEPVVRASEGTKMPRAKWDYAESLVLLLPPLPEQRAIARILGTLDDKIEANRRMNETLEAIARALFTSWFVDFDPVRAKAEGREPAGMDAETAALFPDSFEETELGEVPKGWELKSLDEIADFLNGLAMQKFPPESEDFLPVIKIAELHRGNTIGSDRANSNIDSRYIIKDGDILFSWSGSLEVCIWCGGKGALNQHLFKVSSTEYPMWFLYFWLKELLPEFQLIAAGKATTMGHIQRHHLSEAKAVIPIAPLIERVNVIIEPLLKLIIKNNLESRSLSSIRDALLPRLLLGEIQVRGTEKSLEDLPSKEKLATC